MVEGGHKYSHSCECTGEPVDWSCWQLASVHPLQQTAACNQENLDRGSVPSSQLPASQTRPFTHDTSQWISERNGRRFHTLLKHWCSAHLTLVGRRRQTIRHFPEVTCGRRSWPRPSLLFDWPVSHSSSHYIFYPPTGLQPTPQQHCMLIGQGTRQCTRGK